MELSLDSIMVCGIKLYSSPQEVLEVAGEPQYRRKQFGSYDEIWQWYHNPETPPSTPNDIWFYQGEVRKVSGFELAEGKDKLFLDSKKGQILSLIPTLRQDPYSEEVFFAHTSDVELMVGIFETGTAHYTLEVREADSPTPMT